MSKTEGFIILITTFIFNFTASIPGYWKLLLAVPCSGILGFIAGRLIAND